MIRYLLDTGIASDFINRRKGVHERAKEEVSRGNRIGIGIPVLAELLYGIDLLVREADLERAVAALGAAGHRVAGGSA